MIRRMRNARLSAESTIRSPSSRSEGSRRVGWGLMVTGCVAVAVAAGLRAHDARAAAWQDWPPFVLVAGLLLVGWLADGDGLFTIAGERLARMSGGGLSVYFAAAALVAVVTAVLNLDTSVAFLTPIFVYAGRRRGGIEAPLLYASLLLSNTASVLLPGSNLTNLIVVGQLHLTGIRFFIRMAPLWLVAVVVTTAVVAVGEHRNLRGATRTSAQEERPVLGLGLLAVVAVTVSVLTLRSPALPVAAIGLLAVASRLALRRQDMTVVIQVVGIPALVGLFGIAVALGTLGRAWAWPAAMLSHLDTWATAGVAAVLSVLVNNLPAASLLAARPPHHPFALLVGLDIGPNLFVTGSLAWLLWLRAASAAGARPSIARASLLGCVAVPLSMAGALAVIGLTSSH